MVPSPFASNVRKTCSANWKKKKIRTNKTKNAEIVTWIYMYQWCRYLSVWPSNDSPPSVGLPCLRHHTGRNSHRFSWIPPPKDVHWGSLLKILCTIPGFQRLQIFYIHISFHSLMEYEFNDRNLNGNPQKLPVNSVFCFKSSKTSGFSLLFCLPISDYRLVPIFGLIFNCGCVLVPFQWISTNLPNVYLSE